MNRLIGYVGLSHIKEMKEADIKALDIINLAFGTVKEDKIDWEYEKSTAALRRIRSLNPTLKILLSVGGWGCGGFSIAATTAKGRETFAKSAKEFVEKAGLDGIDIDWEYPCIPATGIDASPDDKENFTLLLAAIRHQLDQANTPARPMLTIAAGGGAYYIEHTQMEQVQELLDYVQIMTYDLQEAYIKQTGHHTNLYPYPTATSKASVDNAVNLYLKAGVPPHKIVIGVAFYSRKWDGVLNVNQGYGQPALTIGDFGPDYGDLANEYINKNGYQRYWDSEAKAPYLFNGESYISYDDQESIALKIKYVQEKGLYGIMYWEYKCDTTYELTQFMAQTLKQKAQL